MTTWPAASTPCTWKTDLAMSRPIVVIVCMARSSESWELNSPTSMAPMCRWRSRPQHQNRTHASQQESLFDHLVGEQLHRVRHIDAKGLCCLHVNDQLELARAHDGQIGGLLAFENAADKVSGLAIGVNNIRAIASEPPGHNVISKFVNRRDRVALCQSNDLVVPIGEECISGHHEP